MINKAFVFPCYDICFIPLYRRNKHVYYSHGDLDYNQIYLPSSSSCRKDFTLVSVSCLFPEKYNYDNMATAEETVQGKNNAFKSFGK